MRFEQMKALVLVLATGAVVLPACDEAMLDERDLEIAEIVEDEPEDVADIDDLAAPEAGPGPADGDAGLGLGQMREPTYTASGWTVWTSEEYPPVVCDPGSVLTGFGCSGGSCDNVRLHCSPAGVGAHQTYWSAFFSEEGTNYAICPFDAWVTGIACNGGSCDNISIQCTSTQPGPIKTPPKTPAQCQWTGWMSEENGGTLWLNYYGHVRGVQCSGGKCDNKRFYLCNM